MIGAVSHSRRRLEHVLAVHVRQAEVEDHQVRRLLGGQAQSLLARFGLLQAIPSAASEARRNRRIGSSSSITRISGPSDMAAFSLRHGSVMLLNAGDLRGDSCRDRQAKRELGPAARPIGGGDRAAVQPDRRPGRSASPNPLPRRSVGKSGAAEEFFEDPFFGAGRKPGPLSATRITSHEPRRSR